MDKRITPDECKAAYRNRGLMPSRGAYITGKYACGIGAVVDAPNQTIQGIADCTYGRPYRLGFARGFDGAPEFAPHEIASEYLSDDRYKLGYQDGCSCAAAVFALIVVPEPVAASHPVSVVWLEGERALNWR